LYISTRTRGFASLEMPLLACHFAGYERSLASHLLERQFVPGVFPAVDNVEARNGEGVGVRVPGDVRVVLPKWHPLR